jgi:hypothetical protein
MNYFLGINTLDDAKKLFRELCIKLHPDTSGADTQAEFIKMYNEFKKFKPSSVTEKQQQEFSNFNHAEFYNMIKKFEGLKDINISFVGSFVWLEDNVPGATFYQKDKIKSIELDGYNTARFASVKKTWYFSPKDYQQKGKSNKDLDTIKSQYGCKTFKTQNFVQLT